MVGKIKCAHTQSSFEKELTKEAQVYQKFGRKCSD
jgi:hypothetical protein